MKLGQATKESLDYLPFDGDKSKITGASTVLAVVNLLFPNIIPVGVDPWSFLIISATGFAVSRFHRWLKVKYPNIPLELQ